MLNKVVISIISVILLFSINFLNNNKAYAQIKGVHPPEFNPDTVFIFQSPRPLISDVELGKQLLNVWGIDLIFSGNGFGMGLFYNKYLNKDFALIATLYISGARNTDEFEYWDYTKGDYRVPNKVNRLYLFPLMLGVQKTFLRGVISDKLLPYIQVGAGPALIMATPYSKEFFSAFGSASSFIRFGGFLGLGASFNSTKTTTTSANIRYYYIPFGRNGLESIKNYPIKDFGGVFLSLSLGIKF